MTMVRFLPILSATGAPNMQPNICPTIRMHPENDKVSIKNKLGPCGGQVLAFQSYDPSSNTAEAWCYFSKICVWKERK